MRIKYLSVLALFLLLFSLSPLHSEVSTTIDWSTIESNVDSIENNLKQLHTDNKNLEMQLMDALRLLDEQKKYSVQQQVLLQNCEDSLKKSELHTKIWKGCFIASIVIVPITTLLIYQKVR